MTDEEIKQRWFERAERLNQFIEEFYSGNRAAFARAADIARSQVDEYAGPKKGQPPTDIGKTPGVEMLMNFMRAKLNISWWISGVGSMEYNPDQDNSAEVDRKALREQVMNIRRQLDQAREALDGIIIAI